MVKTPFAWNFFRIQKFQRSNWNFRPEEFSIQSNIKRLDIFEEDRQRIQRSALNSEKPTVELISQPGVFNFYQDWSDAILSDLEQLTAAVDQVTKTVLWCAFIRTVWQKYSKSIFFRKYLSFNSFRENLTPKIFKFFGAYLKTKVVFF